MGRSRKKGGHRPYICLPRSWRVRESCATRMEERKLRNPPSALCAGWCPQEREGIAAQTLCSPRPLGACWRHQSTARRAAPNPVPPDRPTVLAPPKPGSARIPRACRPRVLRRGLPCLMPIRSALRNSIRQIGPPGGSSGKRLRPQGGLVRRDSPGGAGREILGRERSDGLHRPAP